MPDDDVQKVKLTYCPMCSHDMPSHGTEGSCETCIGCHPDDFFIEEYEKDAKPVLIRETGRTDARDRI